MGKQHQRWATIIDLCQSNKKVSVEQLVNILNVSEATIRRDLTQMEDLHIIRRYHGGVMMDDEQSNEPNIQIKNIVNDSAKDKVARLATQFIKDNQMVFIDAGSSTLKMIDYITAKNITVVTTGIQQIDKLISKNIPTIVLGGGIRPRTCTISGIQTLKQLDDFYFDVAFIGVNAIHERMGFTTTNEQEAEVKKKVITHSTNSYLLADSTKFNKLCPVKYADLNQAIVLSDEIYDFNRNLIQYLLINEETNI